MRADHLQRGAEVTVVDSLIAGSISGAVARYVSYLILFLI